MKHIAKFIALTLAVLLLCGSFAGCSSGKKTSFTLPTRTLTEDEARKFGTYEYRLFDDDTAVIVSYTGSDSALTIPDSLDGHKVVELGIDSFSDNTQMRSLKLNPSLEKIGDYAFYGCTALTEVSFGKKLWSIGIAVFDGTPWLAAQTEEYLVVGDGILLKYQGNLTDVRIPDGIKHLSYAFDMYTPLIRVEMGSDILTVGRSAFAFCPALKEVIFGENTVLIDDGAFDNCETLTTLTLPDSVERVGEYAFNFCNYLTEITLGKSLKYIGAYAFRNCLRLKTMTIPSTVEYIGSYSFADCYTLTLVFYEGTAEQFAAIPLESSNFILKDVDKVYLGQ